MRRVAEGGTSRRRGKATFGGLLVTAAGAAGLLAAGVPGATANLGVPSAALESLSPSTTAPAAPTTTTTAPPAPTTTTTAPPARATVVTQPPPAPAPVPTTTTPPPPPPAPATHGILPPSEPPANIPPSPNFLQSCQGNQYDDSARCVNATLSAIDNGRAREGLLDMSLPSNWSQLTVEQQIFVSTNLERTVRGLPPLSAMAEVLDQSAAQGAAQGADPSPPSGFPATQWGSNWAGAVGNPLEAIYYWMYDDGIGSSNIDCTQSNQSGCWGHRNNVLMSLACHECVMGTGFDATGWQGDPSLAEILVDSAGQPTVVFTWQQEQASL